MEAWVLAVCAISWTLDLLHSQNEHELVHTRADALTNWASQTDGRSQYKYGKLINCQ